MKKVSHRAVFALILAAALVAGLALFVVRYCTSADDWATFPGSPHVYQDGALISGSVTDRGGETLLSFEDGKHYAENSDLRKATMHLLGDREGYIASPVMERYAATLAGFDFINGTYSLKKEPSALTLTVSADAQKTALADLRGRKGTVGVYNYRTGEILCAVTSPTYDPESVPDVAGDTTGAYDGVYVQRLFGATYVPGSIFKLVTTVAALETVPNIEEKTYSCEGTCDVEGDTITCEGVHGHITLREALAKSCNCAFANIALDVGAKNLEKYAKQLGVAEPCTFDGITTARGNFDLSAAAKSDTAWAGIGQYTDLVNPCSYLRFVGAIAGGGSGAEPYLVAKIGTSYRAKTRMTAQLMKPETAEKLADMMKNNVETVYGAGNFPDVTVCAKSGTAEVGEGLTPHATFTGFVQDENYPMAFIVVVENGGSGSATCTSIAADVLRACMADLDAEREG